MNTFIAPSAAALTFLLFEMTNYSISNKMKVRDPCRLMNSILSGLVAITASCNNVDSESAFVIGIVGCLVYVGSSKLMHRFKIDDPIEAS